MSATVAPSRAATSTSRSRPVSGDAPPARVAAASAGIDDALAGVHPPHRVGELLGRRVLDDEAGRAGFHRAPQVARPPERGQDDHAAAGHLLAQRGGRGQPVHAGHLDVEQGDVRLGRERGRDDLVAPPDLGHDLEVVLEVEQCRECRADERLVVGQQEPDHGSTTATRSCPARSARLAGAALRRAAASRAHAAPPSSTPSPRLDPLAQARQPAARPADAAPAVVDDLHPARPELDRAVRGPGVAHHVGHALAHHPAEQLGQLRVHDVDRARAVRR